MAGAAVPHDIARRAVEWMVELQSPPVPDELRREWQQWLTSHPDHERAWQRIEAVNDRLRGLSAPQHPAVTAALLAPRGSNSRRQAVKALSVLMFTGTVAWTVEQQLPWRTWNADQRTGAGERRQVALADGTRVALNTGTAFDIAYDSDVRRLRLLAGEILVTTAIDASRPFLVHTAQGELHALGTRFAVRLHPHATQVSVFEGAVALRPARLAAGLPTAVMQAGQQALFGSDAVMPALAADEDSVAWTDGFLIAKSMRLAALMAELSRYSDVALGCAPEVAELRVSGSYRLDDIGRVLETLSATLDLEIETTTRFFGRFGNSIRLTPRHGA